MGDRRVRVAEPTVEEFAPLGKATSLGDGEGPLSGESATKLLADIARGIHAANNREEEKKAGL